MPLRTLLLAALLSGCDYSGDFLFAGAVPGLSDIYVLTSEDGGPLVPVDITSFDAVGPNTIYAEVGPATTTAYGGVTFDFIGTGGDVCIWVDPEVASWSPAVADKPVDSGKKWAYPDNVYDDGDLDLFAGLSVYYTGSPGESIGDFKVAYEDSLGNEIPISLAACPNTIGVIGDLASAGRGSPEYCGISATDIGISHTVLLRTWSTPLDDDRLSYGVFIANVPLEPGDEGIDPCQRLRGTLNLGDLWTDECLVQGEAMTPIQLKEDGEAPIYYGFDALNEAGRIWEGSIDFEAHFCSEDNMARFCNDELDRLREDGRECEREVLTDPANRCYCGDINDTPSGGAF